MTMRGIGAALILSVIASLPLALPAQATWLGLSDGNYDVTLTCTTSPVIPCPSQIQGSLTISGAGASFMQFTVDGLLFSGDPTDIVLDATTFVFQRTSITLTPLSFLTLNFDTLGNNDHVADDNWWGYCRNSDGIQTCFPNTFGSWVATASAAPVNEPESLGLFALGLAVLGFYRRRRA